MTWKRFTTLIISILSLLPLYKLVQACADMGDYEAESTFFSNEITAKPAYQPFYYTQDRRYYDDSWYNTPVSLPDANIMEWQSYTNQPLPAADMDSIIYNSTYAELKSLYGHIEKAAPLVMKASFTGNAFVHWLKQTKDLEALGYLMYAKQCEPYATTEGNWEAPQKDTARMNRLIKNGQQLYAAAKSDVIKDKYAFQVIRMAFYAGNNAQTLQLYTQLMDGRERKSYTAARCLQLKAGGLFRMKRKTEAAYLYTQVFDQQDNLKKSAFISYDWCVGQDATPVLKLCKNNHERAVVYVMDGLHQQNRGLPSLQMAYDADPKVAGLDVVMTREINKLEQTYQLPALYAERKVKGDNPYYTPYNTGNANAQKTDKADEEYLEKLNAFAQKAAVSKQVGSPAFWYLSSSYLYFMQRNVADCRKMMEAAKAAGMKPKEADMYHTLQILYAVRSNGKMTPALEAQLLPDLKWLTSQGEGMPFRYAMRTLLTTAYLKDGDTTKAIYTLSKGNTYNATDFTDDAGEILENMSLDRLHALETFAAKKDKTPYERWLTDSSIYTAGRLYELEGTKYLRLYQFSAAVVPLEKGDGTLDLQDPFHITISEKMKWPEDDSTTLTSKLEFAKRMATLEKELIKKPDDAALLMDYATGLYNMSYYGNAYHAYSYYRSSVDDLAYFNSPDRKALPASKQEFYGVMKAEASFAKAALKATNKEQQAKALFMAAKCWQKRCPGKSFSSYDDDMAKAYYSNALKNPYFLQLITASPSTSFYQEAIGTCGYLSDYAKRK